MKGKPFNHWTNRVSRAYNKIRWAFVPKNQRQGHRLRKANHVKRGFIPRIYHFLKGK